MWAAECSRCVVVVCVMGHMCGDLGAGDARSAAMLCQAMQCKIIKNVHKAP